MRCPFIQWETWWNPILIPRQVLFGWLGWTSLFKGSTRHEKKTGSLPHILVLYSSPPSYQSVIAPMSLSFSLSIWVLMCVLMAPVNLSFSHPQSKYILWATVFVGGWYPGDTGLVDIQKESKCRSCYQWSASTKPEGLWVRYLLRAQCSTNIMTLYWKSVLVKSHQDHTFTKMHTSVVEISLAWVCISFSFTVACSK